MLRNSCAVLSAVICLVASETVVLQRLKRQDYPQQGGHVIDSIFNIPITAIKQTAAAAQSFSPENSQAIDSVLKIPVSTLEAVGNLVKATSGQRRQNAEELQRMRQEKRDKIIAQRERQRLQREQLQQQRLKQQQIKRTIKVNNKDPFGLNTLSVLVSNHGLLGSIQGVIGGHGGHAGLAGHGGHGGHGGQGGHVGHGGQGGHGGHGGHGDHGIHGGQGGTGSNHNTYEVYENVEEDSNYSWHGITAGIGTFFGSRPTSTRVTIQNKIAPKDQRLNKYSYGNSNVEDKFDYEDEPPLQNKIAPKSDKISFQ